MSYTTMPDRFPHRWATYPAELNPDEQLGRVMGPNMLGELMTVVEVEVIQGAGITRLGFDFTRASDVALNTPAIPT